MEIYGPVKLSGSLANGAGDPVLTKDGTSNEVGTTTNTIGTLTDSYIFVGNASNVPVGVAVSGDITISNAGVVAIASGVIVNADINGSAAIALTKLAATTASRAIVSDGSGVLTPATTTATEIGYVNGVTSAIQTQIDAKQATITGAATTVVSANLTANRATISNASGKMDVSATTDTELGYVAGVTSAIQTQLDAKLEPSLSSVAEGDIIYFNGTDWINLARGSNGQALYSTATTIQWDTPTINGIPVGGTNGQVLAKQSSTDFDADWETITVASVTDLTASAAELNIMDGVTASTAEINLLVGASGNIQSQLNSKLSTSLTSDNILKGVGGVATASTDLPTGITIGGAAIYRVGGSDITLADGGTGASLADPGADRIMFWDDSAGAVTWLEVGSGLSITTTTIATTGGAISGLTTNRVPYATSATALGDDSAFTWDATNDTLTVGVIRSHSRGTDNTFIGENSGNFTLTGTSNTCFGAETGNDITSATDNVIIGANSGDAITTGSNNTLVGTEVAINATSSFGNNVAVGYRAMNLAAAGVSISGNVAVGSRALDEVISGATDNIAIGQDAGGEVTSGVGNVLLGGEAGDNVTSGNRNVVIGYQVDAPAATDSGQLSIQNIIFGLSNTATGTTVSSGTVGIGISASHEGKLHIRGANNAIALHVDDDAGNDIISAGESGGARVIGFFGVSPAIRQVVPTGSSTDTVITALQALGLFSQT